MSRVEDNRTIIRAINNLVTSELMTGNDALVPVLIDISESLAVIADALERRAEDD